MSIRHRRDARSQQYSRSFYWICQSWCYSCQSKCFLASSPNLMLILALKALHTLSVWHYGKWWEWSCILQCFSSLSPQSVFVFFFLDTSLLTQRPYDGWMSADSAHRAMRAPVSLCIVQQHTMFRPCVCRGIRDARMSMLVMGGGPVYCNWQRLNTNTKLKINGAVERHQFSVVKN